MVYVHWIIELKFFVCMSGHHSVHACLMFLNWMSCCLSILFFPAEIPYLASLLLQRQWHLLLDHFSLVTNQESLSWSRLMAKFCVIQWQNKSGCCRDLGENMATQIKWTTTDIKSKPHTHTQKSVKRVFCYRTSKSKVVIYIWYKYICIDWL